MAIERRAGGLIGKCETVVHNGLAYIVANAPQPGGSIAEQTQACLRELDALLAEVKSDRESLLQVTIYLSDIALKPAMDTVWLAWIGAEENWPQRACVGVDLDPGYDIEIVAIAVSTEVAKR